MKYQVIIVLDDARNQNYYHSYVESNDATLGNIECTELPPYQDIHKARSCYWDGKKWVFDEGKYNEIIANIEAEKEAAEEETKRIAEIPSNEELKEMFLCNTVAINEIMTYIEEIVEPLKDMAALLTGGGK